MKTISPLTIVLPILSVLILGACDGQEIGFEVTTSSSSTIEKVDLCPPDIGVSVPDQLLAAVERPIQEAMSAIGPAIEEEIEKRNTGPINHIYLRSLRMTMKSPPAEAERKRDNTLGFLSKVEVYVKRDGARQLLAESEQIPETATEIVFTTHKVDLKPYVDAGFETEVKVTARYCPGVDMDVKVTTTVQVTF